MILYNHSQVIKVFERWFSTMRKTIRIELRDFAMFLKHNLDGLIEQSNTNAMEELGTVFNNEIQFLSRGKYGYFWDEEEDGDNGFWKPSTAVAINATRQIFGLRNCENILILPESALGWWIDELKDYKSPRSNSLRRDRWRNRGKALKAIPLYNRHFPGVIYLE